MCGLRKRLSSLIRNRYRKKRCSRNAYELPDTQTFTLPANGFTRLSCSCDSAPVVGRHPLHFLTGVKSIFHSKPTLVGDLGGFSSWRSSASASAWLGFKIDQICITATWKVCLNFPARVFLADEKGPKWSCFQGKAGYAIQSDIVCNG